MQKVAVLDFGSQFTQLITRRLRELGFYSEIFPFHVSAAQLAEYSPMAIVLSGGPNSVYGENAPQCDVKLLAQVAPLLGICYGMQLIAHQLGGKVEKAHEREYGLNYVKWSQSFGAIQGAQAVWMSHGDVVVNAPPGFTVAGVSETGHIAAIRSERIWAVQFHPEVAHTVQGDEVLKSFCIELCKMKASWQAPEIAQLLIEKIKKQVGPKDNVLCALSGGVDSSVVAGLLTKALGADRVFCVFVDTGMLRKNESVKVMEAYKQIGLNVRAVDASSLFLSQLAGVVDPETKRKIIGKLFIDVFDQEVKKIGQAVQFLAQGTLYPDVIESVSSVGGSVTIKSHHNVGGLPEKMNMKLVEPLRDLFKDEVRRVGIEIGLPDTMVWRHPFPGPGLAIRIIGAVNAEDLAILRECDDIFISKLHQHGLYAKIWQAFCVLLPVQTVGVQGDSRTYEKVLALRAVTSSDGMTADWFPFEIGFLREVSNEITNRVKGVNRVVYDVTSKPPATIEWE
jgi:GMP synthase (glutamine-hydrolysing)